MNGLLNPFILGAGGFIPPAGLRLWVAADSLALNNNDPVPTWPDLSGEGNDFAGSGVDAATFATNQINGLPAVQFFNNGADSAYFLAPLANFDLSNRSIFIVFREYGSHVNSGGLLIFPPNSGDSYNNNEALDVEIGSGSNELAIFGGAGTGYQISNAPAGAAYRVWAERFSANTGRLYLNGIEVATDGYVGFTICSGNSILMGAQFISNTIDPSYAPNVFVAEAMVFDNSLSDADFNATVVELKSKYAIA